MIKKIVFLGDSITDAGHLWTSDDVFDEEDMKKHE